MTLIKLFRDTDIGGSLNGGPDPIPEDVRKKIEDAVQNHIIKVQVSSASVDKMRDIHKRTAFKSGAEWAYETIALPTIQAQEERIRVLEEALRTIRDGGYTGAYMIAHEALIKSKALTLNL